MNPEKLNIANTDIEHFPIIYGCAELGGGWNHEDLSAEDRVRSRDAIFAAIDAGYDFFDHAGVYCHGKSETVFGEWLSDNQSLRDRITVQTKCGIRFAESESPWSVNRYDFSADHILASVESSLRRLQTDRIDILLLHRPDPLAEPEEIARAFDLLQTSGKVRFFGVSNHSEAQILWLETALRQKLVVNQLQLSLAHPALIQSGVLINQAVPAAPGDGLLPYCQRAGISLQAWSPLDRGRVCGGDLGGEDVSRFAPIQHLVGTIAESRGVSPEEIALAWILRHPAGIAPVLGTRNPERIRVCAGAVKVKLSREEWYALFTAAHGKNL